MDKLRPHIFVDVDGVLNFYRNCDGAFDSRGTVDGITYHLRLNSFHGQWLTDLAEKTGAELAWERPGSITLIQRSALR